MMGKYDVCVVGGGAAGMTAAVAAAEKGCRHCSLFPQLPLRKKAAVSASLIKIKSLEKNCMQPETGDVILQI